MPPQSPLQPLVHGHNGIGVLFWRNRCSCIDDGDDDGDTDDGGDDDDECRESPFETTLDDDDDDDADGGGGGDDDAGDCFITTMSARPLSQMTSRTAEVCS